MSSDDLPESTITYKDGNIVWVKLGSKWWPGEVKTSENLPPGVEFKKPPLAVVKFFEEDAYEYVRSWSNICPYNCDKKAEFIKKGMAAFRANVPHMEKFPKDVSNAEVLIGGNPNILSEPEFIPEKKRHISNDDHTKSKIPKSKNPRTNITHRRFLGCDDYKAFICIQYPEKGRIPGDKEDDEVIMLNREPQEVYNCFPCGFNTKRLEVMIIHMKFHVPGMTMPKKKNKKLLKIKKDKGNKSKSPKRHSSKSTFEKISSSKKEKKELTESKTKINNEPEIKSSTDIRTNLLAEWGDSDDEMDNTQSSDFTELTDSIIGQNSSVSEESHSQDNSDSVINTDHSVIEEEVAEPNQLQSNEDANSKSQKSDYDTEQAIKSCFDFDEEDEEQGSVIIPTVTTSGRKIPRVIPERRRSGELDNSPNIDYAHQKEDSETHEIGHERNQDNNDTTNDGEFDNAFNLLMETTSVPELPDINTTLKCEQNFHGSKTIKFPDKSSEETPTETVKTPEIEKRDPSTEVATKLTNPKKRFVKSFEDFESKQNIIKKKVENKECNRETDQEASASEEHTDFFKLKTRIMSKIIEQANIDEECRNKIMAKMEHPKSIDRSISESKEDGIASSSAGKKTKDSEHLPKVTLLPTQLQNVDISTETNIVSSKKLFRRLNHPKKDKTLLETFVANYSEQASSNSNCEEIDGNDNQTTTEVSEKSEIKDNQQSPTNDIIQISNENLDVQITENTFPEVSPEKKVAAKTNENIIIEEQDNEKQLDQMLSKSDNGSVVQEVQKRDLKLNEEQISYDSIETSESMAFKDDPIVHMDDDKNSCEDTSYAIGNLLVTGKEEYDSLEKASVYLPDDAICSPPRKRKQADSEMQQCDASLETYLFPKKMRVDNEMNAPHSTSWAISDTSQANLDIEIDQHKKKDSKSNVESIDEGIIASGNEELIFNKNNQIIAEEKTKLVPQRGKNEFLEEKNIEVVESEISPITCTDTIDTLIKNEKGQIATENEWDVSNIVTDNLELNKGSHETEANDHTSTQINTDEVIYFDEQVTMSDIESTEKSFLDNNVMEWTQGKELNTKTQFENDTHFQNSNIVHDNFKDRTINNSAVVQVEHLPINDKLKHLVEEIEVCSTEKDHQFEIPQKQLIIETSSNNEVQNISGIDSSRINTDNITESSESSAFTRVESLSEGFENNDELILYKDCPISQNELVPIEGNLKVVSESDLGDGQVEITPDQIISSKTKINPLSSYAEFSDSTNDSSCTTDTFSDNSKGYDAKGTEFNSKSIMKEVGSGIGNNIKNVYGQSELLHILESSSDSETKVKDSLTTKMNITEEFFDFEDHIPSQIVCAKMLKEEKEELIKEIQQKEASKKNIKIVTTTSKLLERLADNKKDLCKPVKNDKHIIPHKPIIKGVKIKPTSSKTAILSDQILQTTSDIQMSKPRTNLDIEDVEAFIIHKDPKKIKKEDETFEICNQKPIEKKLIKPTKQSGKAKILQQTIITASGEIIQPTSLPVKREENIFDINSMPIVLSDDLLTPESIEKIPFVMSTESVSSATITEKVAIPSAGMKIVENKVVAKITSLPDSPQSIKLLTKQSKGTRVLQSPSNRIIQRGSSISVNTSKPGKYILIPQNPSLSSTKGFGKKMLLKTPAIAQKGLPRSSDVSGNKIMILTNEQGQQQRLLLTPAQQKLLGCPASSTKIAKTIIKGNVMQSNIALTKKIIPTSLSDAQLGSKTIALGQSVMLKSPVVADQQVTTSTNRVIKTSNKKILLTSKSNQSPSKVQRTVLIKNQQPAKKIQGTNEQLEKQVAEQLEAIKASSVMNAESSVKLSELSKTLNKTPIKRSYSKKIEPKEKIVIASPTPSVSTPAAKKVQSKEVAPKVSEQKPLDRPLNQVIFQDAVGTQTTVTEGQIVAIPNETVDGHPQSYMLVTVDESGNLIPLNNEALMSLDPHLSLGGDISNMVLQIEQGPLTNTVITSNPSPLVQSAVMTTSKDVSPQINLGHKQQPSTSIMEQPIVAPPNTETQQQLIISGDPAAAQKFLESLSDGTTDLATFLANAEGSSSIFIDADGQIVINPESDKQMLLSVNKVKTYSHDGSKLERNPVFATEPNKSQDILAAALADTDVFQPSPQIKYPSQLSPNNSLYPINVGNVLETSLTLSSPIMTPLEVPSTKNKKIPDEETNILTQVPKNVDLPITITDPNISQTVASQQVASLIANELQTNLELNLPISEAISSDPKNISSLPYGYSIPALDDTVDITHKTISSSSMPLLSEDVDEHVILEKVVDEHFKSTAVKTTKSNEELLKKHSSFLDDDDDDEDEGRFTLGREMCSSLSEPPPEMFDIAEVNSSYSKTSLPLSLQSTPDSKEAEMAELSTQTESSNEGSYEIPVQPQIVTKSQNLGILNSE